MKRRATYFSGVVVVLAVLISAAWYAARVRRPVEAGPRLDAYSAPFGLVVDLTQRQLIVMEDGQEVRSYPVAVGSHAHPTPRGNFAIRHIVWNPRWVPPDAKWARHKTAKEPGDRDNPMGNVKMFFEDPDYYIHGTHDYDSLGEPESHGCVRMANSSAVALAQDVMENGGKPMPESWFERVLDHFRDTRQIYLRTPIPVAIRG